MAASLAIVDSGGANIASLMYALDRLGARAELTTDSAVIRAASRVILPGVGRARDAMERLARAELPDTLRHLTQPVLGVCLGLQLLAEGSEEDDVPCLGIVPGRAGRLPASPGYPVPNMGWCAVRHDHRHPLLKGIDDGSWFYFVHSYALPTDTHTVATAAHAVDFTAVLARDNFAAAQCHPERSSGAGSRLLANFLEWRP